MLFYKRAKELTKNTLEINPLILQINDEIIQKMNNCHNLPRFLKSLILSNNSDLIHFAIYHSRELLKNDDDKFAKEFVKEGFIAIFLETIEKFKNKNEIIFEIIWCLINISFVINISLDHLNSSSNFILVLDFLLSHEKEDILVQTLWLISNLINENEQLRNIILNSIAFDRLIQFTHYNLSNNFIIHLTRTMALFVKEKTKATFDQVNKYIKKAESILVFISNYYLTNCKEVLINCHWGLCNLSKLGYKNISNMIIELDFIDNIIKSRGYEIKELKRPFSSLLGNLFEICDDKLIKTLINMGVIQVLECLLNDKNDKVIQDALISLSKLISRKADYFRFMNDNTHCLEIIVKLCKNYDYKTRKNAFIALTISCGKLTLEEIVHLTGMGLFMIFIDNLKNRNESHIISMILECLNVIFDKGEILREIQRFNCFINTFEEMGGIDLIEKLESHPNQSVFEESLNLLEKFNLRD